MIPPRSLAYLMSFLALGIFAPPLFGQGEQTATFADVRWEGLERTRKAWIESFTDLHCPCQLSSEDLVRLRTKLLTTQVFQSVEIKAESSPQDPNETLLVISLKEKWTVIPVVRGAFGGGTPLVVAGIYDTHAFGQLITMGAEARKYGNAKPGGVTWMRAPRWQKGRHYWNLELWQEERLRSFYDARDKPIATLQSSAKQVVAEALWPFFEQPNSPWQYGIKYTYRNQETLTWRDPSVAPSLHLNLGPSQRPLIKFVYDDLTVEGIQLNGLRSLWSFGASLYEGQTHASGEQELFAYKIWQQNWNLSWHHWLGMSDDVRYQSLYYLGGFDSIRGLPDGTLYGTKAAYANLELRWLASKAPYTWWQIASYVDYGSAGQSWAELEQKDRLSAGTGIRVAIPQVNRLMFRLDYAWGLSTPRTSSFSIGMNQFIDPYRPL